MIILFVVLFSYQCKKEETETPEVQVVEMTETINNLLPGTTYYWKIEAQPENQDDFHSETLTRNFNTGNSSNLSFNAVYLSDFITRLLRL